MKILFTRFPLESAFGGAEIQTLSLMEGLLQSGHAVAFAGSCPVLLAECGKRGIPAVACEIGPPPVTKWGVLSFLWRRKTMQRKLVELLRGFQDIDAVCMLSLSEKLLLTSTLARSHISRLTSHVSPRVLWIEHDRIGRWLSGNPWLPLLLRQSRFAVTVTVSRLSRTLYERLGWDPARIVAIENGIDRERLGPPFMRHRASHTDPLRFGCIARLSKEKGVEVLIKAFSRFVHGEGKSHKASSFERSLSRAQSRGASSEKEKSNSQLAAPRSQLILIGTGPEEKHLRRLTRDLRIADRVTFEQPRRDIRSLYAQFDALILPSSDHDPFGLTAAEAMALGIPVIVTDACGIASSLENGRDALIVNANSVSALKAAMNQLSDPQIFNTVAQNGPGTAQEQFSMMKMVQSYEALLRSASPSSSR